MISDLSTDEQFWLYLWITLSMAAVLIIVPCVYITYKSDNEMIEKGYIQKVVLAKDQYERPKSIVIWTKPGQANIENPVLVEQPSDKK
jgi:hypothetical protein